jgi:tetratricopeptide (TPR) repeat protein
MSTDELKQIINESSEMSKRGDNALALRLLDSAIEQATKQEQHVSVRVLTRHASAIADSIGDLQAVRRYREQCFSHDPENPITLASLADVLQRQGETKMAKQYALRAYRLASERRTELDEALISSLRKTWPDLDYSE